MRKAKAALVLLILIVPFIFAVLIGAVVYGLEAAAESIRTDIRLFMQDVRRL